MVLMMTTSTMMMKMTTTMMMMTMMMMMMMIELLHDLQVCVSMDDSRVFILMLTLVRIRSQT